MRIAVGLGAAAVDHQAGDLDPRHHHRGGGGGEGGGGGGGGAQQQQQPQEPDDHRLLQLHHHQEVQQEPPVFQLQQLQAAAVRQRGLSEYAIMGDAGHGGGGGGYQPQLLSFGGGGGVGQHQLHQFTAQATAAGGTSSRSSREIVVASPQSRGRGGGGGGEIVAVQGGHIVRSTGRKDRHSKVCTARGPRDRRVRLSAHTAIQFYDVQDRLGYDRPSKAVDWLIKNAKDAIDKLDTLPPWHPTATNASNATATNPSSSAHPADDSADNSADDQAITVAHAGFDFPHPSAGAGGASTGGFLPSSLDSDSIADTIKSFFPMGGTAGGGDASSSAAAAQSSAMGGFQSYTPDLLSRTGSHHSQELRLSLQSSLSDPTMFHHHHHHQQQQDPDARPHNGSPQQVLFPGYSFGGGMWAAAADQHQRMLPWGNMPDPGGGGGYLFNVSQQQLQQQQLLFQRGPLQSSNNNQPSSDRGWPETTVDNPMFGFSGFRVPGRMQGDEDHNAGGGGNGDKPPPPSSVSSASHH